MLKIKRISPAGPALELNPLCACKPNSTLFSVFTVFSPPHIEISGDTQNHKEYETETMFRQIEQIVPKKDFYDDGWPFPYKCRPEMSLKGKTAHCA